MRDVVMNRGSIIGEVSLVSENRMAQTEMVFPGRITVGLARKLSIPWDEFVEKTRAATERFGVQGASAFIEAWLLNVHLGRRAFGLHSDARSGMHVRPIVKRYHGDRPYSEAELWKHPWNRAGRVGISLRTGEVILDVDHKDGVKAGWEHLIELEAQLGSLPPTAKYDTLTGGAHILFNLPQSCGEEALSPRLARADGVGSHIDILRAKHRYAVVHDLEFWCDLDPRTVLELPAAWVNWATREARLPAWKKSAISLSSSLGVLADTVQQAPEGERNTTLSLCALRAFSLGFTFDEDVEVLREAALAAGLEPAEIEATLLSARDKAWTEWQPLAKWIDTVDQELETASPRTRHRLRALALTFASHYLLLGNKEWIGMSVRQAEEILGVNHTTTAKYLCWFVERGLLAGRRPRVRLHATEYRIPLKNVDTRFEKHEGVSTIFHPFGIRSVQGGKAALLLGHTAFQRIGQGLETLPTLPPSAASILVTLETGPSSIRDLARQTGFHERTIKSTIEKLESACLVEINGDEMKATYPGDAMIGLSAWSRSKGLEQRTVARRERNETQRSGYKKHVSKLEMLKGSRSQSSFVGVERLGRGDVRGRFSIVRTTTSGNPTPAERKSIGV